MLSQMNDIAETIQSWGGPQDQIATFGIRGSDCSPSASLIGFSSVSDRPESQAARQNDREGYCPFCSFYPAFALNSTPAAGKVNRSTLGPINDILARLARQTQGVSMYAG
jgi:hypothetical protein